MLKRKIVTALLSSLITALIFSSIGGFDWNAFFNLYYLNVMFVVTYGVLASVFSDWLSGKLAKKAYTRELVSFLFHCLLGSIFQAVSLIPAILFFIVDRLLRKVKVGWLPVSIAGFIVVLVFIILMNS